MRCRKRIERPVAIPQARAQQRDVVTRLASDQFGFDAQVRASMEALERSYALLAATVTLTGEPF